MAEMILTGEEAQFKQKSNEPSPNSAEFDSVDILNENIFEFLDAAYFGTGGFRNGNYLVPHKRELFFKVRKQFSYYVNFVKPIIRAMVEPVFVKDANRKTNNIMVDAFIKNVDNRGTSIQNFAYMVTNICRRHSIAFVVVDNFSDQPVDLSSALSSRTMPYCYARKANQMKEYTLDCFGNLVDVLFIEKPAVYERMGSSVKEKTQYRRWTTTYTALEENENERIGVVVEQAKFVEIPGTRRDHNLGVVPVVVIRDVELEQPTDFVPEPKIYDLARVNHAIFNKDSEVREIERNQAFAVFCVNQNKASSLTIGTNNVVFYPIGSNPPQFVSPPTDVMNQLILNRKELREDLFRLAEQNGVVAVQEAKSGIALAYEFFAHESILQQTAKIATTLEEKIVQLFGMWIKNSNIDYTVVYRSEFVPHGEETKIKMYDTVLMQNPPTQIRKKIFVEEYKALFPGADVSETDLIESQVDVDEVLRDEAAKDAAKSGDESGGDMSGDMSGVDNTQKTEM
jgi:hypothetical protein